MTESTDTINLGNFTSMSMQMETRKCPQCGKEGRKSVVFSLGASTTLVHYSPYWDEDGNYHNHDGNTTTHQFKCSEGHFWNEKSSGSCWCGWKGTP